MRTNRMIKPLFALGFVLMVAVFAVGNSAVSAQASIEQQELDAAEARWATAGPASYQISYDTSCFCQPSGPALFTIVNGVVTGVASPADAPYSQPTGRTVEQMFTDIGDALASNHRVTATYDAVDGHPVTYNIVYLDDNGNPLPDGFFGVRVFGLMPGTDPLTCHGRAATLIGTDRDDNLEGSFYADVIMSFGGDDTVYGRQGHDTICGGDGDDLLLGDTSAPIDIFAPIDQDDVIIGGPGRDRIYGQGGTDHLLGGDDVDYLWGGLGVDTLEGNGGSDRLRGGHDNDHLFGGSGADRMWGDDGDDEMFGQGGQDRMWGGAGNDAMQGNWQSDSLWGGDGNDTIGAAEGRDAVFGGPGDDTLYGGDNADGLSGGAGDDTMSGGNGQDDLLGGLGADVLNGGPHTDLCSRGPTDTLLSCQTVRWELDDTWTFVSGTFNGQAIAPVATAPITLTLTEEGVDVSGSAGCNSYFGTRVPEMRFQLVDLVSTEIACLGTIMEVEQVYFQALSDATEHVVSFPGRRLRLNGPVSELIFVR